MTSKEIADQLVNKMYFIENTHGLCIIDKSSAKKCALITVDYIIETLKEIDITGHIPSERFEDWNEVKKEIESL